MRIATIINNITLALNEVSRLDSVCPDFGV
jgi:hypothetical protein